MWLRVLLKTLFISAAMTTDNHETMSISTSTRPEIIAGLLSMQMKRSSIARGDEALPRDYPPGGGGWCDIQANLCVASVFRSRLLPSRLFADTLKRKKTAPLTSVIKA